jgi:hypothetical protein
MNKIVLSASRRTDIPAFYMDWFMERIRTGFFEVKNPFNQKVSKIYATPDLVHTIVFWSKNFGPFLEGNFGEPLLDMGYHLYFSFTINSDAPELEPNIPPVAKRIAQLYTLSRRFSPKWIDWRFDPICVYKTEMNTMKNNLNDIEKIAEAAGTAGVDRCITSFMDHYKKIKRRVAPMSGFSFLDPPLQDKIDMLLGIKKVMRKNHIGLYLCCEKEILEALPEASGIKQSSCIPNSRLKKLFGEEISLEKDKGQRVRAGCGCGISKDIGSYSLHPCFHNCLFCYANPSSKEQPVKQCPGK